MLDTIFAVTGKKLSRDGKTFTITSAGIKDDRPYATVEPHDDFVVRTIVERIGESMPLLSFSLAEIQKDLDKPLERMNPGKPSDDPLFSDTAVFRDNGPNDFSSHHDDYLYGDAS